MVTTKSQVLMLMVASFVSAGLAVLMAGAVRSSAFLLYSVPGFVVGAFFAYKYFTFDRSKQRQEEHERRRDRRRRH